MMVDRTPAFEASLGTAPFEAKPAQLWRRATSRHSTATSLSESLPYRLAEDLDNVTDRDLEGATDWDTFPDEEQFQDRPRFECHFDEEMAYRPDLYCDAFEVADGDLMLYDLEAEDLPEAGDAAFEVDRAADKILTDTSKSSTFEGAPPLLIPKAPLSPAPRGFTRKHQNVLVVSPPAEDAFETLPSELALAQMPQGSALAAVAALRPADKSARGSDSAAKVQPVVPIAPAEKPLTRRPCSNVTLRL